MKGWVDLESAGQLETKSRGGTTGDAVLAEAAGNQEEIGVKFIILGGPLGQDSSDTHVRGVNFNYKLSERVWLSENRG
ncbi:unnamed protein product [Merluccius merluccius]